MRCFRCRSCLYCDPLYCDFAARPVGLRPPKRSEEFPSAAREKKRLVPRVKLCILSINKYCLMSRLFYAWRTHYHLIVNGKLFSFSFHIGNLQCYHKPVKVYLDRKVQVRDHPCSADGVSCAHQRYKQNSVEKKENNRIISRHP